MKYSRNQIEEVFPLPQGLKSELEQFYSKQQEIESSKTLVTLLENTAEVKSEIKQINGVVSVFPLEEKNSYTSGQLRNKILQLNIWRKGPFQIGDVYLDAEWDSRKKWDRISPFLPDFSGKIILDIGANSGYYMYRILERNPKYVIGIDPSFKFKIQFEFLQKFAQLPNLFYECFGIEWVNQLPNSVDAIFCMGILYHRRDPIQCLKDMKVALKKNGVIYLETLIIPGEEQYVLCPYPSYGKMKNVYYIPTEISLINWCQRAGFKKIKKLDVSVTGLDEQRNTEFCPEPSQSLKDFLQPEDNSKTIEGYPAHTRIFLELGI